VCVCVCVCVCHGVCTCVFACSYMYAYVILYSKQENLVVVYATYCGLCLAFLAREYVIAVRVYCSNVALH